MLTRKWTTLERANSTLNNGLLLKVQLLVILENISFEIFMAVVGMIRDLYNPVNISGMTVMMYYTLKAMGIQL